MPPQENLGNINTVPQQQTPLEPPRSSRLVHSPLALAVSLAVIVVVGVAIFWYKPSTPVPSEMRIIGITYYPQQTDAVIGFKQGMEKLGYKEGVNVTYDMAKVVVGPTMIEEFTAAADRMIAAKEDMIYATFENEAAVALQATKKSAPDMPI